MSDKPKCHVVKVSSSGLGDAIKAMLAGALYSEVSGRCLIVDWRNSRYSVSDENTFYELFDLHNIKSTKRIPSGESVAPESWHMRLDQSMHEVYTSDGWENWDRDSAISNYSIDYSQTYSEEVTVSWDFDQVAKLLPFYPNITTVSKLFHYAANKFLLVNEATQHELIECQKQLPSKYMAVHIRATREFDLNKGAVPVERYFKLIEENVENASEAFFVASDNAGVQDELAMKYKNLVSINKWFAKSGEALHLSNGCPDKLANVRSALLDMLLLAHSSRLVCNPNSCFSECAQYLSPLDNQEAVSALVSSNKALNRLSKFLQKITLGLRRS